MNLIGARCHSHSSGRSSTMLLNAVRLPVALKRELQVMLTIKTLDWNRLWREDRAAKRKNNDREFWNGRALSFAKHVREGDYDDYVEPFLRILNAQPEWTYWTSVAEPGPWLIRWRK